MSITRFLAYVFLGSFFGTLGLFGLGALCSYIQLAPTVLAFWLWLPEYIQTALGVAATMTVLASVLLQFVDY